MNANIMSILSWSNPTKSTLVLLGINFILWILTRQRPFYVLPVVVLLWYGRQLWCQRIRREVLVDPPDHEEWINLSTYDLQQVIKTLMVDMFQNWLALRNSNHLLWTIGTCTGWLMLAKVGMELDFLTILFILFNVAFVVIPALEYLPKVEPPTEQITQQTQSSPAPLPFSDRRRSQSSPPTTPEPSAPSPVLVTTPGTPSSPLYRSFYEGIVTRSISAAAVSLMASPAGAVFNIGGNVSTTTTQVNQVVFDEQFLGPETLTPEVTQMPDVDQVDDSDPEDEFLFDARHFDKSSSSTSVSNSFEIIDDDMSL